MIVIGGGVAGLKAAGDLQRGGAEVVVLEARDRWAEIAGAMVCCNWGWRTRAEVCVGPVRWLMFDAPVLWRVSVAAQRLRQPVQQLPHSLAHGTRWYTLEANTSSRPCSLHSPVLAPCTHPPLLAALTRPCSLHSPALDPSTHPSSIPALIHLPSLHSHPRRLGGRIHTRCSPQLRSVLPHPAALPSLAGWAAASTPTPCGRAMCSAMLTWAQPLCAVRTQVVNTTEITMNSLRLHVRTC